MAKFKARIESGFTAFGHLLYRHPLKTLFILLVMFGGLASQLPKITFDTSTESFFRQDDPALIDYNAFRRQFGRDEFIVIAVKPPDVFDRAFLEKLRAFHTALEHQVPHLYKVTSLINARNTRGEGDRLIVEDLLKEIPKGPREMAAFKHRVLSSHLYPNLLISEDGKFTTVLVETQAFSDQGQSADVTAGFDDTGSPFDAQAPAQPPAQLKPLTDAENSAVVRAVERVMARFNAPDFPLHVAGSPVVTDFLKRAMQRDMMRFVGLAVLAIGLFLFVLFRRISGVVLPLVVVGLSLISTIGLMAGLGVSLKLPHTILPSFLLAVGVGATLHLLSMFYRDYQAHGDKEEALATALGHSGLPIVMTSLTTAAGLLSFATANMASVAQLGIFAGVGVLIALVYTLVLLPALLALWPIRQYPRFSRQGGESQTDIFTDRMLIGFGDFSTRHAWGVTLVSAVIVLVAIAGLPRLHFSQNSLLWFPKTSDIRRSTDLIDTKLKGSLAVEMVIDTGQENGLYQPAVLNDMQKLERIAKQYRNEKGVPFVGKTNGLDDVVMEINQALNENRDSAYVIPQNRDLIAQELLLFENSGNDDLERMVDSQFSKARLTLKVPWDDASVYVGFVDALQKSAHTLFGPHVKITTTGLLKLFTQSIYLLMQSMVESYTIAVVVITLLMILLIGRFRLGLLSMIPNLTPILITLGLMGWLGIRLDAFTLLIGSIALGLAVDDTIHFFHNFLRYYERGGDVREAVRETLLTSGRAMLFATLVLVVGFWLFMFASLNNLYYFGLLTGFTLLVALLADIMLSPALLELVMGRRRAAVRAAEPQVSHQEVS